MVASIGKVTDADYYTSEVAADRHDYYAGHGEAAGRWSGAFATARGLDGEVDAEVFAEALANIDPATGGKLKPRANYATLAYDVTFSPVKSVSVLWALAPPAVQAEVVAALEEGHAAAVDYLQQQACVARLGKDGCDPQPGIGLMAAVFRHRFSREADPQLHHHTVLVNATQAEDGRRAALDGTLLWAHAQAADARMQAVVRAELTARLGVAWQQRREQWEVAGIPPALCRQFSKRRAQIEQDQAARGGAGARDAQQAALRTRARKTSHPTDTPHARWATEAVAAGHDPDAIVAAAAPETRGLERASSGVETADAAAPAMQEGDPAVRPPASRREGGPAVPPFATMLPGGRQDQLVDAGAEVSPDDVGHLADSVDEDALLVDRLLGPEGLTEQASSFGRRDILRAIARATPLLGEDGAAALARMDALADRVLTDPRTVVLLNPTLTSGEVIRLRDEHGAITRVVRTQPERRYSTVDLLAAEHDLITRAVTRQAAGVAVVPDHLVDERLAQGGLDEDQAAMVRQVTTSGAGVDVVVGKAGTGKTTAIKAATDLYNQAGLAVRGVAPSATAAHQLATAAQIPASTLDLLLTQLDHDVTRLAPGTVVVLDEAGMCSTRNRLRLQHAVDAVGGKVIDVGDSRQIPSVDVGGCLHLLGHHLGASTLGINHRFRDPQYAQAADLIWQGRPDAAIAMYEAAGAVYEHPHPDQVHRKLFDDWAQLRADGFEARMYATTHATVDLLNAMARAHLRASGDLPSRGRTYRSADGGYEVEVCAGERVRLGRNQQLVQPDGSKVKVTNGMEGTVTQTARQGVTVDLDPAHVGEVGRPSVTLPSAYVGEHEHLRYGYAITADSAQSATVDHALYAASGAGSLNRGYVALSRGRLTNRIYAVTDNGWRDGIGRPDGHTPAITQAPDPTHPRVATILADGAVPGLGLADADHVLDSEEGVEQMLHSLNDRPAPRPPHRSAAGQEVPLPHEPPALDDGGDRDQPPGQREPASVRWLHPLPDPPSDDGDREPRMDAGERMERDRSPGISM